MVGPGGLKQREKHGIIPRMKLVSDNRCRVQSRDLFKPNTPYEGQTQPDGSGRLIELVERHVPVVNGVRTKEGFVMFPRSRKLSRKAISAAIRADRDAR